MTHPDKAIRELMKVVGATLRPMGFRGSVKSWTKVTPHGRASIGRSSRKNWHNGNHHSGAHAFFMGLEAVPETWWRYRNWRWRRDGEPPVPIEETHGPSLMEFHGLPSDPMPPTRGWSIRPDPDHYPRLVALEQDATYIRAHLPWAVERLAHRALELIEPGRYLKELLNQPDKGIGDWEPIVVFLAEYGPSSALDDAIEQLRHAHAQRDADDEAEIIVEYAHAQ